MRGSSLFLFTFVVALGLSSAVAQRKQRPTHSSESTAAQKQQIEDDKQGIQKLHDADIQASLALDTATLETLWTDDIVTMAPCCLVNTSLGKRFMLNAHVDSPK